MIAIKDFKMPRGCYECPFADESIRMDCDYYCQAAKEKPDVQYGLNKPDWCPLVDVPDEAGNCSEIPNSSDSVSRRGAIDAIEKYYFEFPQYMERFVVELMDAMKADLKNDINALPPVQPEIILCKDCEYSDFAGLNNKRLYCMKHSSYFYEDDFCSYAVRKEDV